MPVYVGSTTKRFLKDPTGRALGVAAAAGGGGTDFADHYGPTIQLTYLSKQYRVPLFMKGFEFDPTWTGTGVRFREPRSERQFRPGAFSASAAQFSGFMGNSMAYFGANCIGYGITDPTQRAARINNTMVRLCGGGKDPEVGGGYSAIGDPLWNSCSIAHSNLGVYRADKPMGIVGVYHSTLPFPSGLAGDPGENTKALAQSAARGELNDWYKAFASRMKVSAAAQGDPIIVSRPNWEAQNQDTGMKILGGGNWYLAGLTQREYNSMMRHFINMMKAYGPTNLYIVFSPAFQTVKGGTLDVRGSPLYTKTYQSYMVDRDDGKVGYTGTCASVHPIAGRTDTLADAKSLIDGNGLTDGANFWSQLAIDAAKFNKVPFFSCEHGVGGDWGDGYTHGPSTYMGDTYVELGERANDPDNYGYIAAFGGLGEALYSNSFTSAQILCKVSGHVRASQPGGKVGIITHDYNQECYTAANITNANRVGTIHRKYFGKKSTYGSIPIPARA